MSATVSDLHNLELAQNAASPAPGTITLKALNGIARLKINKTNGAQALHFEISPWAQRLEGLSVDGADVRHEANLVKVEIRGNVLHVTFTKEGLATIKDGSQIQFIDFFR